MAYLISSVMFALFCAYFVIAHPFSSTAVLPPINDSEVLAFMAGAFALLFFALFHINVAKRRTFDEIVERSVEIASKGTLANPRK